MREFFDRKRRYVALVLAVVMALMSPLSSVAQTTSDEGSFNLLEALMPERELLTEQTVTAGEVPAYPASDNEEKAEEDSGYVNLASGSETVNLASDSVSGGEEYFAHSEPIDGVIVTVKAAAGVLPPDAKLTVEKASENDAEYIDAAIENTKLTEENTEEKSADDYRLALDITFTDENGNEIEPDGEVELKFILQDMEKPLSNIKVYHIIDSDAEMQKNAEELDELIKKIESEEIEEEDFEFPDGPVYDNIGAGDDFDKEQYIPEVDEEKTTQKNMSELKETPYVAESLELSLEDIKSEKKDEKPITEVTVITDSFSTYTLVGTTGESVAQVGEKTYSSLQDAFDDAPSGSTVKVLTNVVLSKKLDISNKLTGSHEHSGYTLDLNDNTISGTIDDGGLIDIGNVHFTLIDTSENKKGKIKNNSENSNSWVLDAIETLDSNTTWLKTVISGGIIEGHNGIRLYFHDTQVTGGTIDADDTAISIDKRNGPADVLISGGTIIGHLQMADPYYPYYSAISGGSFSELPPADIIKSGKGEGTGVMTKLAFVEDGTFVIGERSDAKVENTTKKIGFASIKEAIESGNTEDGDSITLCGDATVSDSVAINDSITIDLASHTLDMKEESVLAISSGKTVTLDNGSIHNLYLNSDSGDSAKIVFGSNVDFSGSLNLGACSADISDGKWDITTMGNNPNLKIYGGLFKKQISGHIADGYVSASSDNSDYPYTVRFVGDAEAAVLDSEKKLRHSGSLSDVFRSNIQSGDTVTLLKDITIPAGNLLWKSNDSITVTLDLNGKTITGNYAGPLLNIENIELSIIDSSVEGSGERAGTIKNESADSSAYVLKLTSSSGWIRLKISAGNYIGYNGIEFQYYDIDLSNLNITAQRNALEDTQNIAENIAISSGKFKGSVIVGNGFKESYGKITGGLFTHKLDSRLYAGNSTPHRQFKSEDTDYPYTVDKSENAAAENYSDIDKNIEGLGYYSLSQALSDASENAKIRVLKPVTSNTEISHSDIEITGKIEVKDSALLEIKAGKYDTIFSTSGEGKIQISGGYFVNAPVAAYIAEEYAVVANTDTDTKDVYKYKVVNLKDADCEAKVLHNDGTARYYLKLSDALNSVAEGNERETVYLLKDVTVRNPNKGAGGTASLEPIAFEKSVILDLNKNKLTIGGTNTDGHPEYIGDIQVKPGKNVVIKNGSINTTMENPHEYAHSMFQLCDGANITFSNVDIKGFCPVDFFEDISNQATAVFEGTDTKVEGYSLVSSQPTDPAKTKLVVNAGSYTLDSWYFVCLENQSRNLSKTTREINGGQFVIREWGVSKWSGDATTIYGGDFTLLPDQASVTVKEGKGIVKNAADAWSVGDPSELDCEAYIPGTYNNNKIYYRTIGAALNDVHETKTVTLCKDAILNETVVASCSDEGKTITLDLNGRTLKSSSNQTISVAEDTILEITSSNENGTFTNFTTGNSAGGKIIFEKVNVEGSVRLLDCETEIKSGKWNISTMSLPPIESGKLRISGGKFNTKLSEYLATGCYFFENPDADRNDYPYLVDKGYTVSFVLNGHGGEISPVKARAGYKLAAPATPSDVSYTFDGWFKESGCENRWNFDTDKVTEDTTLYAKWTETVASVTTGQNTYYYGSLNEALDSDKLADGSLVRLYQDSSISSNEKKRNLNNNMTIDLGGNTITFGGKADMDMKVADGKHVTIQNGTVKGYVDGISLFLVGEDATLTIKDATVSDVSVLANLTKLRAQLILENGDYSMDKYALSNVSANKKVIINGGNHKVKERSASDTYWNYLDVEINGGNFNLSPDYSWTDHSGYRHYYYIGSGKGIIKNTDNSEYPWSVATLSEADCEAKLPKEHCIYEKEADAGIYYRTIGAALNDVHETRTVTLCKDATLEESVTVSCSDEGKTITLDLNGRTLKSSSNQTISVAEDTILEITSSNENGTFTNFTTGNSAGGKIIFEKVNVEGSVRLLDCETEIKSGKWNISTMSLPPIESGKLRISGGKFNTKLSESYLAEGYNLFKNPDDDKNVYKYTVDKSENAAAKNDSDTDDKGLRYYSLSQAVSDASANAKISVLKPVTSYTEIPRSDIEITGDIEVKDSALLEIKAGKYDGVLSKAESAGINITGGYFKNAPMAAYIADGYAVFNNPDRDSLYKYLVKGIEDVEAYVEKSGTDVKIYYDYLSDALDNVTGTIPRDTVVLLKDLTVRKEGYDKDGTAVHEAIKFSKDVILDLNGKTLTVGGQRDTGYRERIGDIPVSSIVEIKNGCITSTMSAKDESGKYPYAFSMFQLQNGAQIAFASVSIAGYCPVDLTALTGVAFRNSNVDACSLVSGQITDRNLAELEVEGGTYELESWFFTHYTGHTNINRKINSGQFKLGEWGTPAGSTSYGTTTVLSADFNLDPDDARITIASGKGIIRNIGNSEYPWSVATLSEADCEAKLPKEHCIYEKEADAGIYYRTIGTALNDVHETKTVTLCKDATLEESVTVSCSDEGKTITLDLNGKKLTSKQTISVAENTTLEITGSTGSKLVNFYANKLSEVHDTDGTVRFRGDVAFEGDIVTYYKTYIESGKWSIKSIEYAKGQIKISGGKFTNKWDSHLETGYYFFDNPDADRNDYPYLVDKGYTVSFVLNGHGGEIAPVKARAGYTFAAPATPSDVSYSFDGWFKESGCENRWNFDTDTVTDDMTLYAKWTIKKYTVSFDMQGHGAQITSQSVEHGGKITKPADPTAEGYLFDGWFTKDGTGSDWGEKWNFEEGTVTADIILHAKWTEAEAYRINSGSAEKIYFASLSEAVNKASDGSTVYVLKDGIIVGGDSATGEQLNLDKTFIIDLNGKTLVSRFSRVGGQNKTITIQNGTLRSSGGDNDAGLFWLNDYNTSLVLNDVNTYGYRIAALSCDWDVLTINGGFHKGHTIISANGNGSNQKLSISSGDFELDTWMYDDDNTHNNYTADVTGGNFKLESWKGKSSADSNCKINIEGGNYNLSPDQTFATIKTGKGIIRNVKGAVYPWSVDDISICDASVPNISRVNNDTIYYRTIRDALADADRTETITLLKAVSLVDRVYIGDEKSHRYTVTIDLAGYTFGTTKGGTIGIIGIASGSVAKFDNSSASRAIIENLYMDTFGSGRVEFAESIDFAGALDLNNHRAVITGGRWNISEMGANPKLSIIGGKFNKDYSEYLAEGTQARFYENTDEDKKTYPFIVDERYYTVSFDLQGHGEPQPATLSVIPMATISTPSAVSEEGYEFGGWFREPECANRWNFDTDPVKSDMTLYAKWAKKNYNVYFNMNGHGEQIDTQSVPYGEMAEQPETPQEEGYTFGGWFRDRTFDNAWNFTTDPVKSNMTLHAKWDQNKYEVSFDMHGHGAQIASQSVAHGGKITEPPTPSESGYLFDGWFKEDGTESGSWGDQWSFENDTVTAAVTLHTKWSEAAAVVIDSQNTTYYRTAEEAFAAAQNGDTVKLLKPFEVTEALTVNHSITLDLNGQTLSGNDDRYIIVVENAGFTVTDTSSSKEGKIENRSSDPNSYAVILTADDKTNEYAFTMTGGTISGYNGVVSDWNYHTLNISGGYISASGNEYSTSLSWWNSVVSLNISDGYFKGSVEYAGAGSMTNHGNITGGYYSDKSARSYMAKGCGVLDNKDEATKTAYPYTVGQAFRVEFELNGHGDTYYDVQYVANGGKVVKPEDPTEEGYTFEGWWTKNGTTTKPDSDEPDWGDPWNFDNAVTADTTLYAKWTTNTYRVTFHTHKDGVTVEPQTIEYGAKVVEPEKPYAEGWVFGGWFKEDGSSTGNWGEKWNFEKDIVTAEITLHAKWDKAEASIISTRLTRPEYYTSLTAALASASDADTVTLYKTVEAASTIVIDKNITLDLNGRNISGSLTDCVIRVDGTSLKITDSTTDDTARGRIINNSTSGNSYAVALFGDETVKDDTLIETAAIDTLTIEGVAIEGYNAIWSDFNYDRIEMRNGSITARADGIIAGADGIAAGFWNNCMKLAISGGEIKGMLSYEGAGGIADDYVGAITGGIYSDKPEKTFINPEYGVAKNTEAYPYKVVPLSETSYTVTYDVNGGILEGPSSVTVQYGQIIEKDKRPNASHSKKVLDGWYAKVDEQTWSEEPWNFDTDVVTENLTLRAAWSDAVAEVSFMEPGTSKTITKQYKNFHDAVKAAKAEANISDTTLKLLANVDITDYVFINLDRTSPTALTFDLNGKTLSGSATNKALLELSGNGTLVITGENGGYLTSDNGKAIYVHSGTLEIRSGHFKGSISGATLYGGEYDQKNNATLATGYSWVYRPSEKDYPYAVIKTEDVAAVYTWMTEGQGGEQIEHTEYFATFEDAVTFANTKDEGILQLLNNYEKNTSYVLYKNVEIDLNDHALIGNVAGQPLISVVGANLTVYGKTGVGSVDGTEAAGSLSNTAASGIVISMSDPSKKLSIGSGRYQGSIVYENVQQGQKPAGDIYGGIYSEAPGKKEISGVISSEGYLKEGYEVTDNADDKYPKKVSIRKFTVTFNTLNKDVKVDPQHIEYGQKAKEETPYVKDLAFEGWFTANGSSSGDWGAKWSFDNEIKSDVELFAKWSHAVAALEHAGETKNYNSIADAVAAANAFTEGTAALTLLDNCDINETLAFDLKTGLTLDLKGKNLTGSIARGSLISKSGSGKLTITDSADKTAYGLINNTGLKGGSISVGQGDAEIIAGKIRGAMSAAASQEKTGNITLAGGLYDSEAYASVNGTAVKLADGYVWLNRTEDGTYPYEVISGTELAATYTLNSRTVTFNSLESAVSYVNANAGGTLKLENSYPLSGQTAKTLEFTGNVTLDLNGKSITVNRNDPAVRSEGKISILDSSSDKNGSINNNSGSALEVAFSSQYSKDIVISGGRFKGAVKYYDIPEPIPELPDYKVGVTADIYGGAFSIDPTTVYATHVTAKVLREGYGVTDNGSDTYRYVVGINNYTVTFNGKGGTFTETGKTDNLIKNYKHGDTIGQQPEIKNSDNTKLFDGWFTKDGTIEKTSTGAPDWGNKWNFSTDKVISNMTLYAKWGGRIAVIIRDGKELSFSSIQDAVDAARENETITVLGDVTAYEPIVITGKKLILDLGGHTITANPAGRLSGAVQITGGDVTVKNGKVINDAGTAVKTKDGTVVLSGLTVTSAAAAALSVDGGAMTVIGSTVTGTTGITVNPSASGSGAAKTVTLKVEGGSRITGTTNDGINSFKAEYGTPETGGKVDLKLNNSTINGKDCGIKMQGVDEFDCASEASTCVSEGDYAIDPGSAKGDFNWKGGSLEAAKEIFVISGAVAITVSIAAAFLKAKAMMSLKKAALIAGCTIAVAAITVGLFELLFNSGKGNKPKDEMVRIEYDSKGGSAVPEAFYVPKGTSITVEARPNKGNGSECKGWRCDANNLLYQGGESYTASKDTLFTAEYRYKVTFDTGNTDAKKITSKVPDAQWIDEGGKARKPVPSEYTPIDKNYVLSSWKDGNADFNFETTVINKPYNLKANWKDRVHLKIEGKLKTEVDQPIKVVIDKDYKTLKEALDEANKAIYGIAGDYIDVSINVKLLDNFISSLNAQSVSGQTYETYDVKNDMTLNLANYDISEHLVNTAVFTVGSGSTLSVKGAGAIYSLKTAFKVNDDSSTQKGGGVNITAGAITAATNVISFNQYGAFSISGGSVEVSGDNGNVVYVNNPQTGKITGGITGGYISGGTNIPKPASEEDKLNIAGGFYTEKAKTAFDNVGLPAGYCWKKSGLESHPWTIDKGRVVKFDAKGGIPAPEDQTVSIGERVIKPAAMTKEGFTFDAWYTKDGTVNKDAAGNPDWGEKWAFETRTIADTDRNPICLYAKWDGAVARVDYFADVTGVVKNPTYHASVKTAFDTANADATATAYQITLLKDAQIVTGEEAVAQKLDGTKNYTFDLGEHTLSIGLTAESLRAAITVGQGIDITVKNGKINGTGRLFDNGAVLTLDGSISIEGITGNLIFEQSGLNSRTEFKSGTFTALKLEPSAGSITLTDGKYADIIYEPKNASPVCSINGGVYDDSTKDDIELKRMMPTYNIILNPLKPGWVTNTNDLTKDLYPWTLGDPVAYVSYKVIDGIARPDTYHSSLKEAFEKASADEDADNIFLLKNITIEAGDEAVFNADDEREDVYFELNEHTITVNSPTSAAITVSARNVPLTVNDSNGEAGSVIKGTGKLFSVEGGSLLLGDGVTISGAEDLNIVEKSGYVEFGGGQYSGLTIEQNGGELICDRGTYTNINLESSGGTAVYKEGRFMDAVYTVPQDTQGLSGTPELRVNSGVYDKNTKVDIESKRGQAGYNITLNPQKPDWVENKEASTKEVYKWTLGAKDPVAKITLKDDTEYTYEYTYSSLQAPFDDIYSYRVRPAEIVAVTLLKDTEENVTVNTTSGDMVSLDFGGNKLTGSISLSAYAKLNMYNGKIATASEAESVAISVTGYGSELHINTASPSMDITGDIKVVAEENENPLVEIFSDDARVYGHLSVSGKDAKIVLRGGIYKEHVEQFCDTDYECTENEDSDTRTRYPHKVVHMPKQDPEAYNSDTGVYYAKLEVALHSAQTGEKIQVVKDILDERDFYVKPGTRLDIAGKHINCRSLYAQGVVVDSSNSNHGGVGLITSGDTLSGTVDDYYTIQLTDDGFYGSKETTKFGYLPVYDSEHKGYRIGKYAMAFLDEGMIENASPSQLEFGYRFQFYEDVLNNLLTSGNSGLKGRSKVDWDCAGTRYEDPYYHDFTFAEDGLMSKLGPGKYIKFYYKNYRKVLAGKHIKYYGMVTSDILQIDDGATSYRIHSEGDCAP